MFRASSYGRKVREVQKWLLYGWAGGDLTSMFSAKIYPYNRKMPMQMTVHMGCNAWWLTVDVIIRNKPFIDSEVTWARGRGVAATPGLKFTRARGSFKWARGSFKWAGGSPSPAPDNSSTDDGLVYMCHTLCTVCVWKQQQINSNVSVLCCVYRNRQRSTWRLRLPSTAELYSFCNNGRHETSCKDHLSLNSQQIYEKPTYTLNWQSIKVACKLQTLREQTK